jgi:hypothetical protein
MAGMATSRTGAIYIYVCISSFSALSTLILTFGKILPVPPDFRVTEFVSSEDTQGTLMYTMRMNKVHICTLYI